MIVRFLGAGVWGSMKRGGLHLPIFASVMIVSIAVNQLSVLGAAGMLEQKHMAAARALQNESQ